MKQKQKMHASSTSFVHSEEDVVSDQEENQEQLEEEKKVRRPFVSNGEGQCHEDNEVDWDLPLKFDEYKYEQEEHQEEVKVRAKEGEMLTRTPDIVNGR